MTSMQGSVMTDLRRRRGNTPERDENARQSANASRKQTSAPVKLRMSPPPKQLTTSKKMDSKLPPGSGNLINFDEFASVPPNTSSSSTTTTTTTGSATTSNANAASTIDRVFSDSLLIDEHVQTSSNSTTAAVEALQDSSAPVKRISRKGNWTVPIKGLWDNVVNVLKSAVEAVINDDEDETYLDVEPERLKNDLYGRYSKRKAHKSFFSAVTADESRPRSINTRPQSSSEKSSTQSLRAVLDRETAVRRGQLGVPTPQQPSKRPSSAMAPSSKATAARTSLIITASSTSSSTRTSTSSQNVINVLPDIPNSEAWSHLDHNMTSAAEIGRRIRRHELREFYKNSPRPRALSVGHDASAEVQLSGALISFSPTPTVAALAPAVTINPLLVTFHSNAQGSDSPFAAKSPGRRRSLSAGHAADLIRFETTPNAKREVIDLMTFEAQTTPNEAPVMSLTEAFADEEVSFVGPPPPPPPPPCPPPPPADMFAGLVDIARQQLGAPAPKPMQKLDSLQQRLRNRMKQQREDVNPAVQSSATQQIDPRLKQWASLQARHRKITEQAFMELVTLNQERVLRFIKKLPCFRPSCFADVEEIVNVLIEAPQWFPGGTKELKATVPEWLSEERRIETMIEFVQVTEDVQNAQEESMARIDDFTKDVTRLEDVFKGRDRLWGRALRDNGQMWKSYSLPVSDEMLVHAKLALVDVARVYNDRCFDEVEALQNASHPAPGRFRQIKERLLAGIRMLNTCAPLISCDVSEREVQRLCEDAVSLVIRFIMTVEQEYLFYTHKQGRQEVCDSFEGILRILLVLKDVMRAASISVSVQSTQNEELGGVLYSICQKLLIHIVGKAKSKAKTQTPDRAKVASPSRNYQAMSPSRRKVPMSPTRFGSPVSNVKAQHAAVQAPASPKTSRELVLWLIFGCKFVNKALELLGEIAEDERFQELLEMLEQIENSLPTTTANSSEC